MFNIASICVFIVFRQTSCIGVGECIKQDALGENSGVNINVCCDNYEKDNGTCIECATGYTSNSGYQCKQCLTKKYGKKCLDQCDCAVEKCDHVRGCINESFTHESISIPTTIESFVWLQTSKPLTVTDKNGHSPGLLVYIICAGCVTFVITITGIIMIQKRKRKQSYLTARHQVNNSSNQQTDDLSEDQYTTIL